MQLELGITDGVSLNLVSPWPWPSAAKQSDWAKQWRKKDVFCDNCVICWRAYVPSFSTVFRCGGEFTQVVQQRFQAQFPETKVPHRNAVRQLIQKFQETCSVCDATRSGRPSILTEKKLLDSSDRMLQSPKKSVRKLSQQIGVSYSTTHTAFKKSLRLRPYKITAVHELKPGDSAKRIACCKRFLDFLEREEEDILDVIFFTDKAYFHCQGTSTVKTHVSGMHTISIRSTSRRCMMRNWCLGWNVA
jgi:transposase